MIAVVLSSAAPAIAAVLPVDGAYGNEGGCQFFMTGAASPGMVVLTGDTLSTADAGCDFVELIKVDNDRFTIDAVCSGTAAGRPGMDRVTVSATADGMVVALEDGTTWGPLAPCPGTAEYTQRGVRV